MNDERLSKVTGLRVLVIDDDPILTLTMEDMIQELGATVVGPVSSLDAALDAIEREEFDVATLDVKLRGEKAYPAGELLRAKRIPFMFVSGYEVLRDCPPELEHVYCLTKPFRADDLARAMAHILGG